MTTISISDLDSLCMEILIRAGVRDSDARIITAHFLENELSGKTSHGMVRVVEAAKVARKYGAAQGDPVIETDTGNMVVLDARRQSGVVAGKAAMDTAIERAPAHGIVLVGIRNYVANSGSMAYYLRRLADAGLVVIMGTNSVAQVAPPGGRERRIGTNPVGIAVPGEQDKHFIADFGTSAMVYGKMLALKDKGEPIPEGMLIDKDGNPSTDIQDAYDGAMLPLADYKGFALGLMVELLAGPLINGKAVKQDLYDNDGLFIIAIDPKKMGQSQFNHNVFNALKEVSATQTRPGYDAVTLPGERSAALLRKNLAAGFIDVTDKTLDNLKSLLEDIT